MGPIRTRFLVPALLLAAALGGCGEDAMLNPGPGARPDFSLADVNPTSPSYDTMVSPRSYLGKVSAWYFGHST